MVGHKIGLTSVAVQQQLGVGEPDYGALLDVMEIADGHTIEPPTTSRPGSSSSWRFISPRPSPGRGYRRRRAARDRGGAARDRARRQPDRRLAHPPRRHGRRQRVVGGIRARRAAAVADEIDVVDVAAELRRGDEVVERGVSSAVLGDPCGAVAWLANALARGGRRAGARGRSSCPGRARGWSRWSPADVFRGDFGPLGEFGLTVAGPSR